MTHHRDTALKPRTDPGRAVAMDGLVVLDGPDGVAVTMTADAAVRTADSLYGAAKAARESRTDIASGGNDSGEAESS